MAQWLHDIGNMAQWLHGILVDAHWVMLGAVIAGSIAVLGKSADWLVKEAVALSERSRIPKMVIGATIVSLGTTMPEVAVSVSAAIQGDPSMALGNAVGSIICDTGLILGICCLIAPLPLHRRIVNRQGWLQLGAGLLIVACSFPWKSPQLVFSDAEGGGGLLPQWAGYLFLGILGLYLWISVRWVKQEHTELPLEELEVDVNRPLPLVISKLIFAIAMVIVSSNVLIPSVEEVAHRLAIPEAVIAASLVAFGTSLPELVTSVTATRHGHGDLAVGNVIGADILNVLFVAGAAAAVTPDGLAASGEFFRILYPSMIAVLLVFRIGIFWSHDRLKWPFGLVLVAVYVAAMSASIVFRNP